MENGGTTMGVWDVEARRNESCRGKAASDCLLLHARPSGKQRMSLQGRRQSDHCRCDRTGFAPRSSRSPAPEQLERYVARQTCSRRRCRHGRHIRECPTCRDACGGSMAVWSADTVPSSGPAHDAAVRETGPGRSTDRPPVAAQIVLRSGERPVRPARVRHGSRRPAAASSRPCRATKSWASWAAAAWASSTRPGRCSSNRVVASR